MKKTRTIADAGSTRSAGSLSFKILCDISDRTHLDKILFGDLDVKFLFKIHNEFNNIKRIRFQIFDQTAVFGYGSGINAKLVYETVAYFFKILHLIIPLRVKPDQNASTITGDDSILYELP